MRYMKKIKSYSSILLLVLLVIFQSCKFMSKEEKIDKLSAEATAFVNDIANISDDEFSEMTENFSTDIAEIDTMELSSEYLEKYNQAVQAIRNMEQTEPLVREFRDLEEDLSENYQYATDIEGAKYLMKLTELSDRSKKISDLYTSEQKQRLEKYIFYIMLYGSADRNR